MAAAFNGLGLALALFILYSARQRWRTFWKAAFSVGATLVLGLLGAGVLAAIGWVPPSMLALLLMAIPEELCRLAGLSLVPRRGTAVYFVERAYFGLSFGMIEWALRWYAHVVSPDSGLGAAPDSLAVTHRLLQLSAAALPAVAMHVMISSFFYDLRAPRSWIAVKLLCAIGLHAGLNMLTVIATDRYPVSYAAFFAAYAVITAGAWAHAAGAGSAMPQAVRRTPRFTASSPSRGSRRRTASPSAE